MRRIGERRGKRRTLNVQVQMIFDLRSAISSKHRTQAGSYLQTSHASELLPPNIARKRAPTHNPRSTIHYPQPSPSILSPVLLPSPFSLQSIARKRAPTSKHRSQASSYPRSTIYNPPSTTLPFYPLPSILSPLTTADRRRGSCNGRDPLDRRCGGRR
jgi:hypothetical protein